MSLGDYLLGVIGLTAVLAPLVVASIRLRAWALPGWERAPARLAEAVLGASLLTVILQLLGAVGALGPVTLVVLSLVVGAGVWFALPAPPGGEGRAPPSPPIPAPHLVLALLGAVFLATHWATGLQDVWARGIFTFDSIWYHGPFSARAAEEGTIWPLHLTDPLYLNWFYPQNSELQHAAGMVLFDRDLLSPLLNFAWLGLALLAAWCIGRPYGVAPLSLTAVAILLATGPMVPREAGTMANDIAPIALLLAAAAILINATAGSTRARRSAASAPPPSSTVRTGGADRSILIVAGLAAGLALGTKMTIAGAVAALAVGVAFLVPREARLRAFGFFVGGVAITAGIWFVRNLIHTGNPIPWITEIGPIDLPGPDRGLEGRDPYSVAHYIFESPRGGVWNSYFLTGVKNLLGPGWFLLLGGAGLGALLAIIRPRTVAIRVLGAVSVAAAIAYVFTPLTAAGPEGQPAAFTINFRYALAALALGLALLPLWRPLATERLRLPRTGTELPGELLRLLLLGGGLALLPITARLSDSAYIWDEPHSSIPAAILIGAALIGLPVGLALLGRRWRAPAGAAAAAIALAVVAIGWERQESYLEGRYAEEGGFRFQLDDAVRWIDDNTDGHRIGLAGTSGAYNQYGFYGEELNNHVQFVGEERPAGDFRRIGKCAPWRVAVNQGGYDLVITTPDLDLNHPQTSAVAPERGWLRDEPNAERLFAEGRVAIFRIHGRLDPGACLDQPSR